MENILLIEAVSAFRQDLAREIKNCAADVSGILECDSVREALEILQSHSVDLMMVDIGVPEIEKQELLQRISDEKEPPLLIGVGQEIEYEKLLGLMRGGFRDYFVYPVEADLLEAALKRADLEIQVRKKQKEALHEVFRQQLKYIIVNQVKHLEDPKTWTIMEELLADILRENVYRLVSVNSSPEPFPIPVRLMLEDPYGKLYVISERDFELLQKADSKKMCLGVSASRKRIQEISEAYYEAVQARAMAFFSGQFLECYQEYEWEDQQEIIEWGDRFLQMFPTDQLERGLRQYRSFIFRAGRRQISPVSLLKVTMKVCTGLMDIYAQTLEGAGEKRHCPFPYEYHNMDMFITDFENWLKRSRRKLVEQKKSYPKVDKIQQAMEYIRYNYQKNLNLAIVSNYVSMNYTMFSTAFKKSAGMNFMQYLKMVRIQEAKILLAETNEKIAEVGRRVGYQNDKHFMKAFKSVCGISPSEYRKNLELIHKGGQNTSKN